jgi:hypothetical protein
VTVIQDETQVYPLSIPIQSCHPQSRQSAKLFLQSSELGLPPSLSRKRVCPPPFGPVEGGEFTLACGRGNGGVPIPTRGHTLWCSTYMYIHKNFVLSPYSSIMYLRLYILSLPFSAVLKYRAYLFSYLYFLYFPPPLLISIKLMTTICPVLLRLCTVYSRRTPPPPTHILFLTLSGYKK